METFVRIVTGALVAFLGEVLITKFVEAVVPDTFFQWHEKEYKDNQAAGQEKRFV